MPGDCALRPSRPRAVTLTGPSPDALADEAAKGWLVTLLAARPLSEAQRLPLSALAREAPELSRAVLGALQSDGELEWLVGSPDGQRLVARILGLAASQGATDAMAAIECLRRGVLGALAEAGPLGEAAALLAAADRLAHVCARLASAALTLSGEPAADAPAFEPDHAAEPTTAGLEEPSPPPTDAEERLAAHVTPLRPAAQARPLWMAALERQLAEGERLGRRFTLVLVEIDGAERLRLAEPAPAGEELMASVGRTLRERVRRGDLIAHEQEGRMWVVAGDTGRAGASALAGRLSRSVELAGRPRGAALRASIGLAVFPEDGRDAAALTEHAEEQMFAARAAGEPVGRDPEDPLTNGR